MSPFIKDYLRLSDNLICWSTVFFCFWLLATYSLLGLPHAPQIVGCSWDDYEQDYYDCFLPEAMKSNVQSCGTCGKSCDQSTLREMRFGIVSHVYTWFPEQPPIQIFLHQQQTRTIVSTVSVWSAIPSQDADPKLMTFANGTACGWRWMFWWESCLA